MTSKLKEFFPMIRNRQEILTEIHDDIRLQTLFYSWRKEQQEEFLNFCTGIRGVKILYDSFFKAILNPDATPERINDFLSVLLGKKVRILKTLPNESSPVAIENSLMIMDMVVEFMDGSIGNLEIQKIGYLFPGERAACYSADLLLRQYQRLKSEQKKKFSYKNLQPVYTIVLFEHSPQEFHNYPDKYIHNVTPKSDTGIKLKLLQQYTFISLDIFKEIHQNKDISNERDAWLTFLCSDSIDDILDVITKYPKFQSLYKDIYNLCQSTEKVMNMFSEELHILDVNTTQLMIEQMQNDLKAKKAELNNITAEFDEKTAELEVKTAELIAKNTELDEKTAELVAKNTELDTKNAELDEKNAELVAKNQEIALLRQELAAIQNKSI